jgi:hypothetical protein
MEMEMACEGKAYKGVCENKLAFIKAELRALGLTVPDDHEGRIHSSEIGVEAEFRYVPVDEELHLKVHSKPFFIPCAFIFSKLDNAIENYRGPDAFDFPDPF